MSEQVKTLTAAQEARLPFYRDKWLAIGTSTEETNRAKAEQGMIEAYKAAGHNPPDKFLWVSSPKEGAIIAAVIAKIESINEIPNYIDENGFYVKLKYELTSELLQEARNQISSCGYGQHDASWLAFYDFFLNEVGAEECKRLLGLSDVAQSAGWYWPFEQVCVMSERHCILEREDIRLHCPTGPSIKYNDGYSIYAWRGIRVSRDLIENPSSITVKQIDNERNAEIRRVMVERYGQERFLRDGNAIQFQKDEFGTMYKRELPGDEPLVMVKVVNSTPEPDGSYKDYFIRVPPNMTSAHEAVAWTFNKTKETYFPSYET